MQSQQRRDQKRHPARRAGPENTLPGFALTLGVGVTTLELDIAITKGDVPPISHDPKLNPDLTRGPDGRFLDAPGPLLRHLGVAELQRYDVGRLKPGMRIPRLDELFALVRKSGNEQVRFAIETKVTPFNAEETVAPVPFVRAVMAAIRNAGMARRSAILSFDWRALAVVQQEVPEIGTVYITAPQQWLDHIGAGKPEGSARTVNQPRDIVRMLDLGVDSIASDRPALVREKMQRRDMALPKATPVAP